MASDRTPLYLGLAGLAAFWILSRKGRPELGPPVVGNVTLTRSQVEGIAQVIYDALYGSQGFQPWEDEAEIYRAFGYLRTLDDLRMLATVYGDRKPPWFFGDGTLVPTLRHFLNRKELDKLNAILAANGIDYIL